MIQSKAMELSESFDHNCYWTTADEPMTWAGEDFAGWQKRGFDVHGLVADPGFRNAAKRDFRLKTNSPAIKQLGFVPWDLTDTGPRATPGPAGREAEPAKAPAGA